MIPPKKQLHMKKILLITAATLTLTSATAQRLTTRSQEVDRAFLTAVETLRGNVRDSIIHAGGTYGGEWTRDIAINAWNCANLLLPEVTRHSLWSVTTDNRTQIGHQYWDRIIWVTGAYDHFLATGDEEFLRQAYTASRNGMARLEKEAFDTQYGLFTGPSVFNDGIAGYDAPVFEEGIGSSYVLDYPHAREIKCLSTNCIYYNAYRLLARMAARFGDTGADEAFRTKAEQLRTALRRHFWDGDHTLAYLVDHNGKIHRQQEGLGISFALLFGILTPAEAERVISHCHVSPYGLPSIYPAFARFSAGKPGRHNVMVWPFVNAFWAEAALRNGHPEKFAFELENLAALACRSKDCFYEIYDCLTGRVNGGWQTGLDHEWVSVHRQTWSATGYIRMVLRGMLGIAFTESGLEIAPDGALLEHFGFQRLEGLPVRSAKLDIVRTGKGRNIAAMKVNGHRITEPRITLPAGGGERISLEIICE